MKTFFIILGAVLLIVLLYPVAIFNRLISLRNRFKNAFAQIDVQLKRRYDLIPNLVETAKGYMKHERETLEQVILARNQASSAAQTAARAPQNAEAIKKLMTAETGLAATLGRLFALAERYPDLKANQTMAALMEELSSTENKVAFARQAYNDAVMAFNTYREQFPNLLIAGSFGFETAQLFEVEAPEEKAPVKVTF